MTSSHQIISCSNCSRIYPDRGLPHSCPKCGGLYDFSSVPPIRPDAVARSEPGIWRYRHTFGLPEDLEPISLGEGNTPLLWKDVFGHRIAFKCEYQNPSGSFKDRGSALIASMLKNRGFLEAVEDSSGNAGASFAAYAASGGLHARIYVPEAASGPKRRQIEAYGAELVPIPGSRTDVAESVKKAVGGKVAYASHAYLPFNLPGYATAAYEIHDQLGGRSPGAVIVPAGQGGLLLGLSRGFENLRTSGLTRSVPRIIGVQARACAPLWASFTAGAEGLKFVAENPTLAEGVKVRYPLRGDAVLRMVRDSHGQMAAVDEAEILPARDALAQLGLYVEPTSAIIWPVLEQMAASLPDPVVVVLTGSGLKYSA